jgi:SAM-dependent MidA family methyltransferase
LKELAERIRDTIAERGPITFAEYMALALYDPEAGYYVAGPERSGWGGHFITSPQLDPGFGELWARAVESIWGACGSPERFDVIEAGPGEGGFARSLLGAVGPDLGNALRLHLIEQSPALRARQERLLAGTDAVTWHGSIDQVPVMEHGCFFANEVLDNLPVHLLEKHDGGWLEIFIAAEGERFVEVLAPPKDEQVMSFAERFGAILPHGHRFEATLAAGSFVTEAARRVATGAVIFIDYGLPSSELVDRPSGTLVCYSGAGVDADPLAAPGSKDITVHANWTSVTGCLQGAGCEVAGPAPQRTVLRSLGLGELTAELRERRDEALADGRGADAVRAMSRSQSFAALVDPSGLGALGVITGFKGIRAQDFAS